LANWKKRVGAAKAQEISTEASSRGTRMHKWLENYVKTGETGEPGSNPYSIQSHTMARTIIDQGLVNCSEAWGTEVQLYFPGLYAGTTDLVGIHSGDEAIMDHKQTNKLKKKEWIEDYFIQTTAYALAHNEVHGTKIRKGVIFMCSADNIYQEFIIEGNEFDHYSELWARRVDQFYR
jgi:genome maintenance exonuclease 1